MNASLTLLQQAQQSKTRDACLDLPVRQVRSLRQREPGTLRVVQGKVWLTVDWPLSSRYGMLGDHVLQAGDDMRLPSGALAVLESVGDAGARVVWCADPVFRLGDLPWAARLAQPWRDLRRAVVAGASAAAQLVWAAATLGAAGVRGVLFGRDRAPSVWESNAP